MEEKLCMLNRHSPKMNALVLSNQRFKNKTVKKNINKNNSAIGNFEVDKITE